jgi:hypothetical protein
LLVGRHAAASARLKLLPSRIERKKDHYSTITYRLLQTHAW